MDITQTAPAGNTWNSSPLQSTNTAATATPDDASNTADASPSTIVNLSGQHPDTDGVPSAGKSFTYGVLGLGTPKSDAEKQAETQQQKQTEDYYTAGRATIAALTIGTLLSVLI
jgi:hypothetical protein